MPAAELFVRATIWLALACYPAGPAALAAGDRRVQRLGRWLWSAGCLAYLAHVVAAYGHFYDWSHAVGLRETARQTEAVTGVASGAGLWLNYLFTLVWLADVAWWWLAGERYLRRGRALLAAEHLFLLFIIFNATVAFEQGSARAAGLVVTVAGLAALIAALRRRKA